MEIGDLERLTLGQLPERQDIQAVAALVKGDKSRPGFCLLVREILLASKSRVSKPSLDDPNYGLKMAHQQGKAEAIEQLLIWVMRQLDQQPSVSPPGA